MRSSRNICFQQPSETVTWRADNYRSDYLWPGPDWKSSSLPPLPAASRLITAFTFSAHLVCPCILPLLLFSPVFCYEPMTGRQDGLLRPVEQENEIICEGGSLAGQHHPHHLQHNSTAGTIITGTWTLKTLWNLGRKVGHHGQPVARCQNGS